MGKRNWIGCLLAPALVAAASPGVAAEASVAETPRVVAVEARPEAGRTLVRVETTSSSVNYISYTRDPRTVVVDIYGLEAGAIPAEIPVSSAEVRSVRFQYTPGDRAGTSLSRLVVERTTAGNSPIRLEGTTLVVEATSESAAVGDAATGRDHATAAKAAARASGRRARVIQEIGTEAVAEGLVVNIVADGAITYQAFTLDNPPRLVLDLKGVDNHVGRGLIPVGQGAVERVRVSQFQVEPERVTRVVLDLAAPSPHRAVLDGDRLRVAFGGPEALALLDQSEAQSIELPVEAQPVAEAAAGDPAAIAAPVPASAPAAPEATVHGLVEEEEGTLISLDLKDADIKDVLRYFSEISGLNIILDPGVSGTVTVRLIDVPWNKALDIILKSHGYGKSLDGNVLRIAAVARLAAEEGDVAELERKKLESRPLVTMTRQISYATAGDIAQVIQQTALSSKGQIIIDQRTNTLVITEVDLPEYRQRILDLIKTLDTPTPQVEIEARIVETTKSFAQSFGVQWGFNQNFDVETGSTTDLVFPNHGVIGGDRLISDSGFTSTLPGGGYAVNLPSTLGASGAIGVSLGSINDQFRLDMALSVLEREGKGRVLSAPKITTQSNTPATITSGLSIPVQTIANETITTQYLNANLSLNVTPQVTAEGTVVLKVVVNNSSANLGISIGAAGLPPVNTRQAQTTVLVADGGTAVIGGVFQISEGDSQSRIPLLNRLPVLGWLFKNKNLSRDNTELLIFITPKIKRPATGAANVPVALGPAAVR